MERSNYPEQIEQTALNLAETQREASHLRERLAMIESLLTIEIANAKTPEGKPQFTNEATRNAELVLHMKDDEDAVEIKRLLGRADEKRARQLARLERLRGEFKLALVERQAEIAAAMNTSLVV